MGARYAGRMDDLIQVYLREVGAIPPLTKYQEIELSRHVLANDSQAELAGKKLVESNLAMVVSNAERYRGRGIHILELIQRGNEGLLFALESFSDHPNEIFSVYAAACVESAIASATADPEPFSE